MSFQVQKVLLIRFSSFGDVTQALSLPAKLQELSSEGQGPIPVDWVTRKDFEALVRTHPSVKQVWAFERGAGLWGLLKLLWTLSGQNYSHIFDAHHNLRSTILVRGLQLLSFLKLQTPPLMLQKSQKRLLRWLLFSFRLNYFEQPFSGQRDLVEPLTQWGLDKKIPPAPQLFLDSVESENSRQRLLPADFAKDYFCLAASSAHPLKRWPIDHWKELVLNSRSSFVLLGGPEDLFFKEIEAVAPDRVLNLAGKCSLLESAAILEKAQALVTNDTGLLHISEQLGRPTYALMGPAPFGFPSRPSTKILELNLSCRPCSKHGQGPCVNPEFQKCLVDLRPSQVLKEMRHSFPNV